MVFIISVKKNSRKAQRKINNRRSPFDSRRKQNHVSIFFSQSRYRLIFPNLKIDRFFHADAEIRHCNAVSSSRTHYTHRVTQFWDVSPHWHRRLWKSKPHCPHRRVLPRPARDFSNPGDLCVPFESDNLVFGCTVFLHGRLFGAFCSATFRVGS